jgi:hypothetical protein
VLKDSSISINNTGSSQVSGVDQAAREQEDARDTLQQLIAVKKRRLQFLKLQDARSGGNSTPDIKMEIEDLEGRRDYRGEIRAPGEIAKLEEQLRALGG